jgi:D-glycero-alpha-D-manno-heptose-7-phosphate kinase
VALVKAVSTVCGQKLTAKQLADMACEIEIGKLNKPIGLQDQYAAAFGGFNWITFSADGVNVEPLNIPPQAIAKLESNLLLMFTGAAHDSAVILDKQRKSTREKDPRVIESLNGVKELALAAREYLSKGDLDRFGEMLDQAWQHKKQFSPGVSNERIDRCYDLARTNGAIGGKIAGAGGGGFLMLYCEDDAPSRVEAALAQEGLRRMDYCFVSDGARVLFNAGLRLPEAVNGNHHD